MTIYETALIILLLGFGLIISFWLIGREKLTEKEKLIAFDATMRELAKRDYMPREPQIPHHLLRMPCVLQRIESHEKTQPIDTKALEASLENTSLDDTSPPDFPPSDAELQAIEWLSRNE